MSESTNTVQNVPLLRKVWRKAASLGFMEQPIPTDELDKTMRSAGHPYLSFYLLMAMATLIATSGLLANSAGVIIGAMIVAPLMNPIMSTAFSACRSDWKLLLRSLFTLSTGVIMTIFFAYLGAKVLGLQIAGSEILGRAEPTLLDLGVAVAAGAVAGIAYARKSVANALPGTALSVALVPPLCVVGIGLEVADNIVPDAGVAYVQLGSQATGLDVAAGAFLLFLTNLAGVVLAAEFVLILQGYGTLRKGAIGILVTLAVSAMLIKPLGLSLRTLYSRNIAMKVAAKMARDSNASGEKVGSLLSARVYYVEDTLNIDLKVIQPETRVQSMRERAKEFQQQLSDQLGEPVQVNAEVMVVPIQRISISDE